MALKLLRNFNKLQICLSPSHLQPLRSYGSKPRNIPRMRFIQFMRKTDTRKRLGVVSEDGSQLTELSGNTCISNDMITFINQGITMTAITNQLNNLEPEPITDNLTILPPITNPEKIICIGLNYEGHCAEQNKPVPTEPMFFSKYANTLVGPIGDVVCHKITNKMDWEVELAVVIGKEAKLVPKEKAMDYVFGYCVAQDISARDWQKSRNGGQFLIGKSMDTFCPLGPSLVHKSLIRDVNDLQLTTHINGKKKQEGNTSELVFKIDDMIHRLSQCITLRPGDILLTGTPKGVGMYRDPPEYLKPGDVIESEIQCVGKLINKVVAPPE